MITKRTFKLPLYDLPYEICVVDTPEEAKNIYPEYRYDCTATVVSEDDYCAKLRMIIRAGMASLAAIASESVHMASNACLLLGINIDAYHDISIACIVGHVFEAAVGIRKAHETKSDGYWMKSVEQVMEEIEQIEIT